VQPLQRHLLAASLEKYAETRFFELDVFKAKTCKQHRFSVRRGAWRSEVKEEPEGRRTRTEPGAMPSRVQQSASSHSPCIYQKGLETHLRSNTAQATLNHLQQMKRPGKPGLSASYKRKKI